MTIHPSKCFLYRLKTHISEGRKHSYSSFEHISIDEQLIPIIHACWHNGIHTQGCCQGDDDNRAYIRFEDYDSARAFLRLVEINACSEPVKWSIWPCSDGAARSCFGFSCSFPNSAIPQILERINRRGFHTTDPIRIFECDKNHSDVF